MAAAFQDDGQLAPALAAIAEEEGVDPRLVAEVIRQESGGNPYAVSPKGAQGLMQLMPETAEGLGVTDPFNPIENVRGGVRYLKGLLSKYPLHLALAAYNSGEGAVEQYGGKIPPFPETQNYVTSIMGKLGGDQKAPPHDVLAMQSIVAAVMGGDVDTAKIVKAEADKGDVRAIAIVRRLGKLTGNTPPEMEPAEPEGVLGPALKGMVTGDPRAAMATYLKALEDLPGKAGPEAPFFNPNPMVPSRLGNEILRLGLGTTAGLGPGLLMQQSQNVQNLNPLSEEGPVVGTLKTLGEVSQALPAARQMLGYTPYDPQNPLGTTVLPGLGLAAGIAGAAQGQLPALLSPDEALLKFAPTLKASDFNTANWLRDARERPSHPEIPESQRFLPPAAEADLYPTEAQVAGAPEVYPGMGEPVRTITATTPPEPTGFQPPKRDASGRLVARFKPAKVEGSPEIRVPQSTSFGEQRPLSRGAMGPGLERWTRKPVDAMEQAMELEALREADMRPMPPGVRLSLRGAGLSREDGADAARLVDTTMKVDDVARDSFITRFKGALGGGEFGSQLYAGLRGLSREFYESVVQLAATRDRAQYHAAEHLKNIPSEVHEPLVRILYDNRYRQLKAAGESPNDMLRLEPEVRERYLANPKVQAALDYWEKSVATEQRKLALDSGVSEQSIARMQTMMGDQFVNLAAVTPGERLQRGMKTLATGERVAARGPFAAKKRRSVFARRATGAAEDYHVDLGTVLRTSYERSIRVIAENRLMSILSDPKRGIAVAPLPNGRIPTRVKLGGHDVAVVPRRVWRPDGTIIDAYLPKPYYDAVETVFKQTPELAGALPKLHRDIVNYTTGLALAVPAEAVVHTINVSGRLAGARNVGARGFISNVLARLGGPGRLVAAVTDARQAITTPRGAMLKAELAKYGALRTLGFMEGDQFRTPFPRTQKRLGLQWMRDKVFGVDGWEVKSRVALADAILQVEPNLPMSEVAFRVNDAMGTFSPQLQPHLARILKNIPIVGDPFASTGVAMVRGSARNMLGFATGKTGWSPRVMGELMVAGTAYWYLWNKAADKQHRDPWKAGLRWGDLLVADDGVTRRVIPANLWLPSVARGVAATGVRAALSWQPGMKPDTIVQTAMRDAVNTLAIGRVGPSGRVAMTATTGLAPYLMPGGGFMPSVPQVAPGESQTLNNLKGAFSQLNTIPEVAMTEFAGAGAEYAPKTPGEKVMDVFGVAPRIEASGAAPVSRPVRIERAQLAEFVDDVAARALNRTPGEDRVRFVREQVARVEQRMRGEAFRRVLGAMRAKAKSRVRGAARIEAGANP